MQVTVCQNSDAGPALTFLRKECLANISFAVTLTFKLESNEKVGAWLTKVTVIVKNKVEFREAFEASGLRGKSTNVQEKMKFPYTKGFKTNVRTPKLDI